MPPLLLRGILEQWKGLIMVISEDFLNRQWHELALVFYSFDPVSPERKDYTLPPCEHSLTSAFFYFLFPIQPITFQIPCFQALDFVTSQVFKPFKLFALTQARFC